MNDVNYLKENGFDIDSVFESFGTMELYNEILKDFYDVSEERKVKIDEYLNNHDLLNYKILVHTIKGESAYLGINNLVKICYAHQLASESGNYEYLCDNHNELMNEFNRVNDVIKTYLNI